MKLTTVSVRQGKQLHVIRYAPGREAQAIEDVLRRAQAGTDGLSWPAAAVLTYQVTQRTAADCLDVLAPPPGAAP
jgi:hypothetical protein